MFFYLKLLVSEFRFFKTEITETRKQIISLFDIKEKL